MRLPPTGSSYTVVARYGRYVTRRLRRAGRADLAESAERATIAVRDTGRAWEDADDPIQAALADRDAADDDLDDATNEFRAGLAGRSKDAEKEAPYTLIFTKGVGYFTAAPVDENVQRYDELTARVVDALPATDPARKTLVTALNKGVPALKAAEEALGAAETAEGIAGTKARSAIRAFERVMEKTYGALVSELGKAAAERFFPKTRVVKEKAAPDPKPVA